MNNLIQSIIKNKKTCYFISPHFDDAVLSAGALMSYLSQYTSVVVVNIFTKASDGPYTLSARANLRQCGYTDPDRLFADREKEDRKVLKSINAEIINLDFSDALWRTKKTNNILARLFPHIGEFKAVYPTYRFHMISGRMAKDDRTTLEAIKKELFKKVKTNNAVIFCPLGVGNHIDHLMTRKAAEEVFPSLIYWSDFPYDEKSPVEKKDWQSFSFDNNLDKKKTLAKGYGTQYKAMFADGFTLKPELFFVKEEDGK